jgi:hypothetical protein
MLEERHAAAEHHDPLDGNVGGLFLLGNGYQWQGQGRSRGTAKLKRA